MPVRRFSYASMKVPPKRKGNTQRQNGQGAAEQKASMKVPPKRKGNLFMKGTYLSKFQPQ